MLSSLARMSCGKNSRLCSCDFSLLDCEVVFLRLRARPSCSVVQVESLTVQFTQSNDQLQQATKAGLAQVSLV